MRDPPALVLPRYNRTVLWVTLYLGCTIAPCTYESTYDMQRYVLFTLYFFLFSYI